MKALILAGGFGTRMGPLAEGRPKALLPVKGKPILEHLLQKIEPLEGIDQVFISANRKFEQQFVSFLQGYRSSKLLTLVVEPAEREEEKLGAVRGIAFALDSQKIQDPLLVINGDNLFEAGLFGLLRLYKQKKSPVVALTDVHPELAKRYGIVQLDGKGRIVGFEEKPARPKGTLASTGIYVFTAPSLKRLPVFLQGHPGDRLGDFIAWLSGQEPVYGFPLPGEWIDIGSPEEYERAQEATFV